MFFVVLPDVFHRDRVEDFVGQFGADNFERDLGRLSEAGTIGIGVEDDVFVLFVERLKFRFARIGDFGDVIARLEDGDLRLRLAIQRVVRFKSVGGRRKGFAVTVSDLREARLVVPGIHTATGVGLADIAIKCDLRFERVDERRVGVTRAAHAVVERVRWKGTDFLRLIRVITNDRCEKLEIFDRRRIARLHLFRRREFADKPTIDERVRV